MIKKLVVWLIGKLSNVAKKEVMLIVTEDVLSSKTNRIDNKTAEQLVTAVVKSIGNKVVAFVVKD